MEESRKTWGRCWRENENLREEEEEEEEKPNLIFGMEMVFFSFCIFKASEVKLISSIPPSLDV